MTKDSYRRKEVPIEEVICYECKGQGHYTSDCANKKYKSKGKYKKAMATTWDNNTDNSEEESSSNEEESLQGVIAFVAFTNDSNNESSSESEDESELQEAFDKLFEESTSLEKIVTHLRKENKELSLKLCKKSDDYSKDVELLETNSNLLDENLRHRETIKHLKSNLIGSTLKEENQVLKQMLLEIKRNSRKRDSRIRKTIKCCYK